MNQTDPTAAFTVTAQTISALVSGQPDLKNKFGPGHIRPDGVRLTYRGQHIDARVDGRWVRETGELTTERLDQHYTVREATDIVSWPDWLCALATLLRPAAASAVVSPPTDRADLRARIVAAIKASPFEELRSIDYANGPLQITVKVDDLADTLLRRLAVLPEPTDRAAVLREAYEIAYTEGMRLNALEAEIGVGPYRGALAVAHLLRRAISDAHHMAVEAHDTGTQQPEDRGDLRDRIAEALMRWAEGNNSPKYASMRRPETVRQNASGRAAAVLAELKPELDAIARVRDATTPKEPAA